MALCDAASMDAFLDVPRVRRQTDGCGVRRETTIAEYCRWWRQHLRHRDGLSRPHGPRLNGGAAAGEPQGSAGQTPLAMGADDPVPLWYLKDWHFTTDFPNYQVSARWQAMLH